MENQDEKTPEKETHLDQLKQKVSGYTTSAVQGLKNETIGVLKDFSTKEGLIENSKKMHHLRVFAMVFIIFTLLLSTIAAVITILNGWSSGHNFKDLHFSGTFNAGSLAFAVGEIVLSFLYLRQAYKNKKTTWIPALLIPVTTLFFYSYVSDRLSWYGVGADVAQGCANFAAILSLPPLFLELTVTGHMQKVGNLIKKFFVSLNDAKIHMLRIIGIAIGLIIVLIKIIDLIYISTRGLLFQPNLYLSLGFFIPIFLSEVVYILMTRKHSNFAWISAVVFVILCSVPGTIALVTNVPFAENLSYTASALSPFIIGFEFLAKHLVNKAKSAETTTPANS